MESWKLATETWRAELRLNKSPASIRLWTYYVNRFSQVCPTPSLATRELIIAWLAQPSWEPETRKSARTALISFFGWASRYGGLGANPAADLPSITIPPAEPRPAEEDAIVRALRIAEPRVKVMILLGAIGGMRRAEISLVHATDLRGRDLLIHGKGRKE